MEWRRLTTLDLWLGDDEADSFRRRRSHGTRLPLNRDWRDLRFLSGLLVLVSLPLLGAKALFSGSTMPGVAGVVLGLIAVAMLVRYVRLPVDPDERT